MLPHVGVISSKSVPVFACLQVARLEALRQHELANIKVLQAEHETLKKQQFKASQVHMVLA